MGLYFLYIFAKAAVPTLFAIYFQFGESVVRFLKPWVGVCVCVLIGGRSESPQKQQSGPERVLNAGSERREKESNGFRSLFLRCPLPVTIPLWWPQSIPLVTLAGLVVLAQ